MKSFNFDPVRMGSWLSVAGVLVVAGVGAWISFYYWQARGDLQAAWLSVGAECILVGGLVAALRYWKTRRVAAVIGVIVTLLAGLWSALSVGQKLSEDAVNRAREQTVSSPAYADAQGDLAIAASLYTAALNERVPEGLGPLTTEARSLDLERRVDRLKAERDRAQARVESFTATAPTWDALSFVRGFGAVLVSWLGLLVFGHGFRSKEQEADKPKEIETPALIEAEAPAKIMMTASEAGKLGAQRKRELKAQEEQRRINRNARARMRRAMQKGRFPADFFGDAASHQLPN